MKRLIFIMFTAIGIAGCNILPSSDTFEPLEGKVLVNNQEYTMMIGDFEWKETDFEVNKTSFEDTKGLAAQFKTLNANKGEHLKINFEEKPTTIDVIQESDDGTLESTEITENELTLPLKAGHYIYELTAKWDEGKIEYVFDINVQ